jgi:hypothetical protein
MRSESASSGPVNSVPSPIPDRKIRGHHFREKPHLRQSPIKFAHVGWTISVLCEIKNKLIDSPLIGSRSAEDALQDAHADGIRFKRIFKTNH